MSISIRVSSIKRLVLQNMENVADVMTTSMWIDDFLFLMHWIDDALTKTAL